MKKVRELGLSACVSLVVGNMVGSGIFLLPVSLAAIGSISIFAWIVTSIGSLFLAYIFGQLSKELPVEGGPYAYCRHYLGDFAGYQVSLSYLFANIIGDAATVVALLAYLSVFFPELSNHHIQSFLTGAGIIWLITIINIIGVRMVKVVQVTTTIIKLIPILLIAFFGLFHIEISNLSQLNLSNQSGITAYANPAMLTLFAFGGLESSTVPADTIKNPEVTIQRATLIGTVLTAVIYIVSTIALMGMFSPATLAKSSAPFADAGKLIFGFMTDKFFAIAAIIACFCTITGFLFITGHAAWAAANDGLLPKFLSRISKRGTPHLAFIVSSIVMTIMLGMNYTQQLTSQFTMLITLSNLFVLIPYLYTSISAIFAFQNNQQIKPTIIALLSCTYIIFAIIGSGQDAVFYGLVLLFALTPFFAFLRRKAQTM